MSGYFFVASSHLWVFCLLRDLTPHISGEALPRPPAGVGLCDFIVVT
jgi:hypothetical protein